jgi:aldehyde:ferredoxin oxidoreductase
MFGSNCLNKNLASIIKANDICNRYGLDTISTGACIAFTIECYENGVITKNDTDSLEMTWGNHKSIIAMLEKLAKREGFGDIIADGVKKAAGRIGRGAEKYAMHIGGQEVPAHDSRGGPAFAIAYGGEPTPARHTQGGEGPYPDDMMPEYDHESYKGRGEPHMYGSNLTQVYNAAGICMIVLGDGYGSGEFLFEALRVITGWDLTKEELLKTGERIENMRQAFNIREGIKTPWQYPDRLLGIPPKKEGPRAGITMTEDDLFNEYYAARGWDRKTGKPSKEKLLELGLDDVARELYK